MNNIRCSERSNNTLLSCHVLKLGIKYNQVAPRDILMEGTMVQESTWRTILVSITKHQHSAFCITVMLSTMLKHSAFFVSDLRCLHSRELENFSHHKPLVDGEKKMILKSIFKHDIAVKQTELSVSY